MGAIPKVKGWAGWKSRSGLITTVAFTIGRSQVLSNGSYWRQGFPGGSVVKESNAGDSRDVGSILMHTLPFTLREMNPLGYLREGVPGRGTGGTKGAERNVC